VLKIPVSVKGSGMMQLAPEKAGLYRLERDGIGRNDFDDNYVKSGGFQLWRI